MRRTANQQLPKSDVIPDMPNNRDPGYDARFPLQVLGKNNGKKADPADIMEIHFHP